MIFETNMSIAIKTIERNYIIKNLSVFNLNKINENSTSLKVNFINNKILSLKVKCAFCENIHHYRYSVGELIRKDITIGGCEILGFPMLYIGDYKILEDEILKYSKVNTQIYAMV